MQRGRDWYAQLLQAVTQTVPMELSATMSVLLLLLYGGDKWYAVIPLTILCIVALFYPQLRRRDLFWLASATCVGTATVLGWHQADNHKYLLAYWCLALACALNSSDSARTLRSSARLLIGLAFLFAVIWKLISPDYLSGAFFHYTLLTDARFSDALTLFGVDGELLHANRQVLGELVGYAGTASAVGLNDLPQVRQVAAMLTWWTILIEAAVALAFLWPGEEGAARWRNGALLLFVATTYTVAHVIGFGWVLLAMGLAQIRPEQRATHALYVLTFVLLQVYLAPWEVLLLQLLQGRL